MELRGQVSLHIDGASVWSKRLQQFPGLPRNSHFAGKGGSLVAVYASRVWWKADLGCVYGIRLEGEKR